MRYRTAVPGAWDTLLDLEGRTYVVEDSYCINPRCDCQSVILEFYEAREGTFVGSAKVSVVTRRAGQFDTAIARMLWTELRKTGDLVDGLETRWQLMREIGEALVREALVPLPTLPTTIDELADRTPRFVTSPDVQGQAARKIGRNAPCPCGSGHKYKRCCLGKNVTP
ncbi:SEC-C metal-binding domain-containing protein [Paraliomyxa miuraensis]|uniref:SEC-C metal-binding domain-containing protein n=1 Tax=Paraliomyxa miuraensis TaxID=376150 RepID=UPI002255B355|nr:SEC-C metal-binding domain-containing protein [Paraliomyxa miuraensis]MCX4247125.1 SEC-C metal-binding domain-containing protein [Paraliomyxa miuraensis]